MTKHTFVTLALGILSLCIAGQSVSPKTIVNRIGMEFIHIPAGTFQMGSTAEENEKPVHTVSVQAFYLGKTEVTQGQWQAVMGSSPSHFKKKADFPVENVSRNNVLAFIRKLNNVTGQHYRLPTEAEWEYSCRAGTTGERYGDLDAIAWYNLNSSSTSAVGTKQPNAFGLYDMLGNVMEMCQDYLIPYSNVSQVNPGKPPAGSFHVLRGASWIHPGKDVRAAYRNYDPNQADHIGFRLALDR